MAYNPNKELKLYYSIGEVAKMFDVNESLLRYWEKEFPIISPKNCLLYTSIKVSKLAVYRPLCRLRYSNCALRMSIKRAITCLDVYKRQSQDK